MRPIDADNLRGRACEIFLCAEPGSAEERRFALVLGLIDSEPTISPPPNEPLTLEQLREMDGEPVWVEIPEHRVKEWCIAKFDPLMGRMRLWCSGGGWFDGKNCGKSVFIYRRKQEEAE